MGFAEARGTSFRQVILFGLEEDVFPGFVRTDPRLPESLRSVLELPRETQGAGAGAPLQTGLRMRRGIPHPGEDDERLDRPGGRLVAFHRPYRREGRRLRPRRRRASGR